MSYLHVLVQKKGDNNWICIFKDLQENDLNKQFIKPYKLGRSLFYDGNILAVNDITNICIIRSDNNHEQELKILQEENDRKNDEPGQMAVFLGIGWEDYEIKDCGVNVTTDYLKEAPGLGTVGSQISEFIKHPWVVRVLGGFILLLVATYFKLRS